MVCIHLKVPAEDYDIIRDRMCEALVGNKAFKDNDIMISDDEKNLDQVLIILGDESNNIQHEIYAEYQGHISL